MRGGEHGGRTARGRAWLLVLGLAKAELCGRKGTRNLRKPSGKPAAGQGRRSGSRTHRLGWSDEVGTPWQGELLRAPGKADWDKGWGTLLRIDGGAFVKSFITRYFLLNRV